MTLLPPVPADLPVLIAGPTASGKSALALELAERDGRVVVNADALQVYDGWRILTARPGDADLSRAPHHLYGHVPIDSHYSVGTWLRDVGPFLDHTGPAPVIVGGTGLYFTALTSGLAEIPATDPAIREEGNEIMARLGKDAMLPDLDPQTLDRIDRNNPVRVQRAWEVQRQTGRGLAHWQDLTGDPLLRLERCAAFVIDTDKEWLNDRISRRFDQMIEMGGLEEVARNAPGWDPALPSSQAIGARQLMSALNGEISIPEAIEQSKIATRQYAKRQRSWLRSRMRDWTWVKPA